VNTTVAMLRAGRLTMVWAAVEGDRLSGAAAAFRAFTWVGHSPETGEIPVRTIDSPN
jgi:hypothetical protein